MNIALEEAERSFREDYIPVGAVLLTEGGDLYKSHNKEDHAEILLPKKKEIIYGATIFVTLEPCPMCLFFLSLKRVKRIFFSSFNNCYGSCGSKINLLSQLDNIYKPQIFGGFLEEESSKLLKNFFSYKRIDISSFIDIYSSDKEQL